MRIEPRNPPPPVEFQEWDGLMHLLFQRKNKTIGAILRNDKVCQVLEKNYRTYCALKGILIDDTRPLVLRDLVTEVLEHTGLVDARAAKMDMDDFLT